ncbi:MAG TPA: serine/threonine-protein kinase [Polyangiales bacterium]
MARALPQPGEIIAEKYLVTGLIGRGGMGAVYVVEHRVTHKRLAVKCLLPEHSEQPELVERFLREAQAAGRIQHRYVVDVFDVGQDDGLLYIVMELIDGRQLGDVLRDTRLPAEDVLVILMRAMEGVAAAHALGIVHRDLKPENILVCRGPTGKLDDPRVLDFGISKLEEDERSRLTKSGMMMGTPFYMSFEQINSQRDLDLRVDVYAMGVIMYEALAGRVPYPAESVGALAIQMMSGPPASLGELRPDLSPQLVEVVMRAIARERDQRYPNMQSLIEALAPFVREELSLSMTPARGSVRLPESAAGSVSLRLGVGDAKTLRSTPAGRGEGKLHVDEDDESARPTTGAHDFPMGKLVGAAVGVLVLVLALVLWRRSASDVAAAPALGAPAAAAPTPATPSEPAGPLPASAEPLKRVEAVLADAGPPGTANPEDVLNAAQPEPEEEQEDPGPVRKGGRRKPAKRVVVKRPPAMSLDQMVPKAPELPAEEREPAPAAPAAEPPPAAPAAVPEPAPAPSEAPAAP